MSGVYLVSFDDIAFETSYAMYQNILMNWRIFNRWFVSEKRLSLEEFQKRKVYNVNEFLMKPVKGYTSQQYALMQATIIKDLQELYPLTLSLANPGKYISSIMLSPGFYSSDNVEKVYIYGMCKDEEMRKMKEEKMRSVYSHKIFEFLPIYPNETLHSVVSKRGIKWNILYTYNPFEIAGFLIDEKNTGKEFVVPYRPTSIIPENLFALGMERDCSIRYFKEE